MCKAWLISIQTTILLNHVKLLEIKTRLIWFPINPDKSNLQLCLGYILLKTQSTCSSEGHLSWVITKNTNTVSESANTTCTGVFCWAIVCDVGPTASQQWVNVSCLMMSHWLNQTRCCLSLNKKQWKWTDIKNREIKYNMTVNIIILYLWKKFIWRSET